MLAGIARIFMARSFFDASMQIYGEIWQTNLGADYVQFYKPQLTLLNITHYRIQAHLISRNTILENLPTRSKWRTEQNLDEESRNAKVK